MKRLAAVLAVLAVAALAAFTLPPKPKPTSVGARFTIAPDSSVTAVATATLTGQLRASDAIRYKFYQDGVVKVNQVVPATTLTASLPAPAYCGTSDYKVTAQLTVDGVNTGPVVASGLWSYARPCAAPTLDGVTITPASVTVAPGGQQQFSASAS